MAASDTAARPIRVALVITELNVGGAERCLVNLATGLDRRKFEVAVISLAPRPAGDQQTLVRRLEEAELAVTFLDARSAWQAASTMRRLRRAVCDAGADVVQTFLFHADVLTALACRRMGATRLVQGIRVADPSRWRMRAQRFAARRARRVVCVSQAVVDFARDRVGIPAEKLVMIPNAVDVAPFQAAEPARLAAEGVPDQRQVLLCLGRLHRQKGLDWLLQQAPAILAQLPEHDLVIVGRGPEQPALASLAEKGGLAGRVHFLGWRSDIPQLLRRSALLVLPSRWEGMPNVVLEAMAAGRAVAAADTHGVRELLGENGSSQIFAGGDAESLVGTVVRLGQNPAQAADLGRQNLQRAEAEFSLSAMVGAYQRLYQSLVENASP